MILFNQFTPQILQQKDINIPKFVFALRGLKKSGHIKHGLNDKKGIPCLIKNGRWLILNNYPSALFYFFMTAGTFPMYFCDGQYYLMT